MENRELWFYNCEFVWFDDGEYLPKKRNVQCMVAGCSLVDVVQRLSDYYGDDQIENLSIEIIDDTYNGVMEVSKE